MDCTAEVPKEALLALGKKAEAIQYAEASRGLNQPYTMIDHACEEILISSGLHKEAYRRYGLSNPVGNSYIVRFRAVAKRYPMKASSLFWPILVDGQSSELSLVIISPSTESDS